MTQSKPPPTPMIERLACALIDATPGISGHDQTHIDIMLPKVRAILTEMRTPSEGVQEAGCDEMPGLYNGCDSSWEATLEIWQAMIDAILEGRA